MACARNSPEVVNATWLIPCCGAEEYNPSVLCTTDTSYGLPTLQVAPIVLNRVEFLQISLFLRSCPHIRLSLQLICKSVLYSRSIYREWSNVITSTTIPAHALEFLSDSKAISSSVILFTAVKLRCTKRLESYVIPIQSPP